MYFSSQVLTKKRSRYKRLLVCAVLILLAVIAVLSVFRIYELNRRFPNPVIVTHKMGEKIPAGDVSLEFDQFNLVSGIDFRKLYPDYQDSTRNLDSTPVRDEQRYVLMAKVKLQNLTAEEKTVSLVQIKAEALSWANGIDADIFSLMNEDQRDPMRINLGAGEKLEIVLPYTLYNFQFADRDWTDIKNRKFDLALSYYPVRNIVALA